MKNVETIVESIFFPLCSFFSPPPVGLSGQAQSLLSREINQPQRKKKSTEKLKGTLFSFHIVQHIQFSQWNVTFGTFSKGNIYSKRP